MFKFLKKKNTQKPAEVPPPYPAETDGHSKDSGLQGLLDELVMMVGSSIESSSNSIAKTLIQEEKFSSFTEEMDSAFSSIYSVNSNLKDMTSFMNSLDEQIKSSGAAITQITSSVQNTAEIVSERTRVTEELTETASEGEKKVHEVLSVIDVLSKNVDAIKEAVIAINDISEQTNLLAMNAAIEAAHAGKAGLGFAVVATEIRKLSAVTKADSSNIEKTLKSMIETLSNARRTADEAGKAMKMIGGKVEETTASFSLITKEMQELSTASGHIGKSVKTIVEGADSLNNRLFETYKHMDVLDSSTGEAKTKTDSIQTQSKNISDLARGEIKNLNKLVSCIRKIENTVSGCLTEQETGDAFPFASIVLGHLSWVTKAREIVNLEKIPDGSALAEQVPDHHTCQLGRWIEGPAKNTAAHKLQVFPQLVKEHEELHALILDIFRNAGRITREEKEEKYQQAVQKSKNVITALSVIRDELGRKNAAAKDKDPAE